MAILKAFKFRIYPTVEQASELAKQFGSARFVYNRYLNVRKTRYAETKQTFNYVACANDLAQLKKSGEFPWLKEADSQVLQQSLKDLDAAYQRYFDNAKTGTLPEGGKPRKDGMPKGYPTFWRKHDNQSIRYPQRFKIKHASIYLPKVGWVRLVKHRALKGTLKNVTVSKTKTGPYFVSIQSLIQVKHKPTPASGEVGIDLGLKSFVKLTSGEDIAPPQHYRKAERRLKIRQRAISRKVKGSSSRTKAKLVVAATHEKVRNQRLDFQHKLSRQIVNANGLIAFEDLNIKGMMANHHLAKSIGDASWAQFVNFVTYKAGWSGAEIKHVDRFFPSSQLCSACGYKNIKLKLSDRKWVCTNCGVVHDRDTNAAKNILNNALQRATATLGTRESHAGGDTNGLVKTSAPEKIQGYQQLRLFALEAQRL